MSKFEVKEGHFWIDDQPQLIHAAEFHYYRTPVEEWKNRLQQIKDAGFNTLATYIPWIWHQLEEGSLIVMVIPTRCATWLVSWIWQLIWVSG